MYNIPNLVFSDKNGVVYEHPVLKSVFRTGSYNIVPYELEMIPLPENCKLIAIPDAIPYSYDQMQAKIIEFSGGFPVSVELPKGYLRTLLPAYKKNTNDNNLISSHLTPVGWMDDRFVVPAILIEKKNIINEKNKKKIFSIIQHENIYSFLNKQYMLDYLTNCEIIVKNHKELEATFHFIRTISDLQLSFVITLKYDLDSKTIEMIKQEKNDTITLNLNIKTFSMEKFKSSLSEYIDSISFDVDSFNPDYLAKKGISFEIFTKLFEFAEKQNLYISVNLLTLPGFTDTVKEYEKTLEFISTFKIDYIKLRELKTNQDIFFAENKIENTEIFGLKNMLKYIKKKNKRVKMGYFSRTKNEFHLPDSFKIK
ncbi:MAG: hypothetical protein N3C60_01435 [Calditerrivibrio sp.]|nr:hypothetical protein [Calditerrivibrio sp.]